VERRPPQAALKWERQLSRTDEMCQLQIHYVGGMISIYAMGQNVPADKYFSELDKRY
jgi:hypothetical protein